MRYEELTFAGKTYTNEGEISRILKSNEFYWLIDAELENAVIELKNNTIIWHAGDFYSGIWRYGIFKSGSFYGTWEGGIFENGNFDGEWQGGIRL